MNDGDHDFDRDRDDDNVDMDYKKITIIVMVMIIIIIILVVVVIRIAIVIVLIFFDIDDGHDDICDNDYVNNDDSVQSRMSFTPLIVFFVLVFLLKCFLVPKICKLTS